MGLNPPLNRKLCMGLVGMALVGMDLGAMAQVGMAQGGGRGGQGTFNGRVHSIAAWLDNRAVVTAGAFPSNPERAYTSCLELLESALSHPQNQRINFFSIVRPNHVHFEVADAAVKAGFNVVSDKSITYDLAEAEKRLESVQAGNVVFALSHHDIGYPLVRLARAMVLGDIATHADNLGRYLTDLLPEQVSCHLKTSIEGRRLPAGHPEAFANVYAAAFVDLSMRAAGESSERRDAIDTNCYDCVEGMYVIQQCVASSEQDAAWLPLKHQAVHRKGVV